MPLKTSKCLKCKFYVSITTIKKKEKIHFVLTCQAHSRYFVKTCLVFDTFEERALWPDVSLWPLSLFCPPSQLGGTVARHTTFQPHDFGWSLAAEFVQIICPVARSWEFLE